MEDGAIVNFGNPEFVAQLTLPIDTIGSLPDKQDHQNPLFSVIFWEFIMDVFTGAEESCLDRSLGADAAGEP